MGYGKLSGRVREAPPSEHLQHQGQRPSATAHLKVGEIPRTAIYRDLIDFENNNIPVKVFLNKGDGALTIQAGKIRLTRSYYGKINLLEPFCWIWPNIFDSIGIANSVCLSDMRSWGEATRVVSNLCRSRYKKCFLSCTQTLQGVGESRR
jgi:hypothetical protein